MLITPRRLFLKRGIRELSGEIMIKNQKIKVSQQTVRRPKKKIASIKTIILELKKERLISDDASDILLDRFGKHSDLVTNWYKKNVGQKIPKKYCPNVRQFALSLHMFSAKAYNYVRKQFNTILPHARTLSKWYAHVCAKPGFTDEALKTLTMKIKYSSHSIVCSLMLDEIAIRQFYKFDSTNISGRVDLSDGMDNDSFEYAK